MTTEGLGRGRASESPLCFLPPPFFGKQFDVLMKTSIIEHDLHSLQ